MGQDLRVLTEITREEEEKKVTVERNEMIEIERDGFENKMRRWNVTKNMIYT